MAKNVFRPAEIVNLTSRVQVEPPKGFMDEEAVVEEMPEYTGPTADDLRREAEAFKQSWDQEKASMMQSARDEAEAIIKEAETRAFEEVKRKTDEAQQEKQRASDQAARAVSDAEAQAAQIVADAQARAESVSEAARKEGFDSGREEGFREGQAEVERLVKQIHSVINLAIEKRNEIIEESETQVINLVLLIAKKVVKVISENQRNVVINNVIQALRKLKSRGEAIIRVNLDDVQLTSDHVNDFTRMVESVGSVTVVEDSTVDKGGCIIETDFGEIDARVSSQLHEIEEKIVELAPIRVRGEGE